MADGANLGREVIKVLLGSGLTPEEAATQVFDRELVGAPPPHPTVRDLAISGLVAKARAEAEGLAEATGVLPVKYAIVEARGEHAFPSKGSSKNSPP